VNLFFVLKLQQAFPLPARMRRALVAESALLLRNEFGAD
jgi:hypothetical protein